MGTITFEVHLITPASLSIHACNHIKKHFDLFAFYFTLHIFLFKQIMNGHIRDRKEISNNVKLLTFQFCYVKAHKCHFVIGGQQWWDGYLCLFLRIFYPFPSKRVIQVLSIRDNLILLITNKSHKTHLLSCA